MMSDFVIVCGSSDPKSSQNMPKIPANNGSLGYRLSNLWNETLSRPSPTNISELWKEHLRIRQDLDELRQFNKPGRKRPTDRLNRLPEFLKWCEKVGIEQTDLAILPSNNGLSLTTTEAKPEGEIVANVPHSALLCIDQAGRMETLKKILDGDEMLRTMDNVALAISVAHELLRGEESEWAPYLDILPPDFQTPIFYSKEEFQSLKPSPVFEEALNMYRAIARQFIYFSLRILGDLGERGRKPAADAYNSTPRPFLGSPFTLQNFTFDLYRWCVSIVSTRINVVPSQTKTGQDGAPKMIPALIPFIDLANHANARTQPGSVFFSPDSNMVKLQLNKNHGPGQEVMIYYGKRTNGKFLLHNGFLPELPNPDDLYDLKIGLPTSAPNSLAKVDHLKQKQILPSIQQPQSHVYLFLLCPEPKVDVLKQSALWEFALIFVANSIEDENLHSTENEQKASKFLGDRLRLLIRAYGDEKNGKKEEEEEDVRENVKLAISRLKSTERELLVDYLKCVEQICTKEG